MFDVNIKIISELNSFLDICVNNPEVMKHCRNSKSAFIRNRKLSFERLVLFIVKLCKKTLSVELDRFFEDELKDPLGSCSVSAFCQQRSKLDYLFFLLWNEVLVSSFYHYGAQQTKRWRGYRIIACDGTAVSLVGTEALSKYFGGQSNPKGSFTGAKALLHYDVLNKLFIRAHFATYRTGELPMAYPAIEKMGTDTIAIYDRNFCNFKMVALHSWAEEPRRFVIRAKESHKFIAEFIRSGQLSQEVNMIATPSAIKGLKACGFIVTINSKLRVRLVRVDLLNGNVEVLITNLWESEGYGHELFKDLYFMRWSIETGISVLKNLLCLESFSGQTVLSIKQDFYATIFTANLASVIINQTQDQPPGQLLTTSTTMGRPKTRNWPMQINMNKAAARVKEMIVPLFLADTPEVILETLFRYFRKHMLPVRKDRNFIRKRKNKQSFSKHKTYTNYKAAA
jgi:hypothetical protein